MIGPGPSLPTEAALDHASSSPLFPSSLELSDTHVYAPYIRALLGVAPHFCEEVLDHAVANPLFGVLQSRRDLYHTPRMSTYEEPAKNEALGFL